MLKRTAIRLGLIVLSFALVCGALEIVLAFAKINTRSNIVFDAEKGATRIPHSYYRHTKEGFSEGHFNAHGFRDYERTYEKPPGVHRILVLGDSYIEALEVDLTKSFPALLEKKLDTACAPDQFEVLNLGQSGFGTTDEYLRFVSLGARFSPDMVILAFYVGNDVRNNSRELNFNSMGFYYRLEKDGRLVLDRSLVDRYLAQQTLSKRFFQWVKQRSYLASLISERLFLLRKMQEERRMKAPTSQAPASPREGGGMSNLDGFSDYNIYRSELDAKWEDAFAVTQGVLEKLESAVTAKGATFVIVLIGSPEQVLPERQEQLRREYAIDFDFERPDRVIEGCARKLGIPCLRLTPAFLDARARTKRYLHFGATGGGHWNEAGHELAAETVLHFLRSERLLGSACPPP